MLQRQELLVTGLLVWTAAGKIHKLRDAVRGLRAQLLEATNELDALGLR